MTPKEVKAKCELAIAAVESVGCDVYYISISGGEFSVSVSYEDFLAKFTGTVVTKNTTRSGCNLETLVNGVKFVAHEPSSLSEHQTQVTI